MPRVIVIPAVLILALAAFAVTATTRQPTAKPAPATAVAAAPAAGVTTLKAGDAIPAPKNAVVVRVRGTADSKVTKLDMATIAQMPTVTTTLREPFLKRDVSFTGVRVADFIAITGLASAPRLSMTALDDYRVTLSVKEVIAADGFIATRADGKRISVADGGPIRMILPGDSPIARNTDNWIWSITDIKAVK